MPTTTILGCSFALHPSPRGPVLADPRWQHLPWLVNVAVGGQHPGLREALAQRALWSDGMGGVSVRPVETPRSSEHFGDVPDDEVWAEVATSFVRAPADVLPFCVIEQLIATLDAEAAKPRVAPPWLFVDPAPFDEASQEEELAMIALEQRVSQLGHLDHATLEECRQAGLLAEACAEDRANTLSALHCRTLEVHVRAGMRTWAYLRSTARRLQITDATVPADLLDANVSHELFILQPELSDRIAAYAEWVLEDQQSWKPCEGASGSRLRHDASGSLEIFWRRGPRGQPQIAAARWNPNSAAARREDP